MHLLIANQHLPALTTLLDAMELKGTQSRARTKLLDLVRQAHQRFSEDEYQLVAEHAVLDESGKPVIEPDGTFTLRKPSQADVFVKARQNLLASQAEVAGPTYASHQQDLQNLLDNYDQPLTGVTADAYNALFDALASQEENSNQKPGE